MIPDAIFRNARKCELMLIDRFNARCIFLKNTIKMSKLPTVYNYGLLKSLFTCMHVHIIPTVNA